MVQIAPVTSKRACCSLLQKATKQFIDIQNNLGSNDKLNEYITHRGSASFLVLPVLVGGYLGETLFD